MRQAITFAHPHQPYGFLCPASPHSFFLKDRLWGTVTHYIQAQKFAGTPHEDLVHQAASPHDALTLGCDSRRPLRPDWAMVKENILHEALVCKFTWDQHLQAKFLGTGEAELRAVLNRDRYWGVGPDGTGANRLGQLLMKVRTVIRDAVNPARAMPPSSQWCLVGNIVSERAYGPGGQMTRRGTKHFPAGAKVYCLPGQWGDGYDQIIVIGRHRGSHTFRTMIIDSAWVTHWRAQVVYSPEVLRRIYIATAPGHCNWTSQEHVEEYVQILKQREAQRHCF